MAALQSWDLMAGQAGARPSLTGQPRNQVLCSAPASRGWCSATSSESSATIARFSKRATAWAASIGRRGTARNTPRRTASARCARSTKACTSTSGRGAFPTRTRACRLLPRARRADGDVRQRGRNSYFYYEGTQMGSLAARKVRLRQVKADMFGWSTTDREGDRSEHARPAARREDKDRFLRFLSVPDTSIRSTPTRVRRPTKSPDRPRRPLRAGSTAACAPLRQRRTGVVPPSSRSAAWTSFRRRSSARSVRAGSPSTPKCSRCIRTIPE